jgi:hypothetical protein
MEEVNMFKQPSWYVTPQEFADLVVETMEEIGYFKADEFHHPEDICISFQTVSEALAKGMGYAGRRVFDAEQKSKITNEYLDSLKEKAAMMEPKNLKKVLPDDPEYPVS